MSYSPEFKGPIQGYVVNYVKRHFWRVEATQEHRDLMQDAYVVFMRVKAKYPALDTPQHFMALFKVAWHNHFTDLANADTQSRLMSAVSLHADESDEMAFDVIGDHDNDGALAVMLAQAPAEITSVINLFLSAPQELLELALGSWSGQDRRKRAGGSERINKLLGIPKHVDTLQAVHDYFN